MKRILALVVLVSMAFGAVAASAATEVKMTGDARIYGNFFNKYNYTGWDAAGKQTYDSLTIWERFRLRTDFIANEGLKFRLGIRVNDNAWGASTFTVDNPAVVIQVYQAYLQFKWPNTDVQFTVGLQNFDLPMSAEWLGSNPVFGGTRAAAAVVSIPVVDQLKIVGGFARFLDSNKDFDPTTTQKADEFDGYFLSLPITVDGFSATPWGLIGVAGRDAKYTTTFMGNGGPNTDETLGTYLFSAGTYATGARFKNPQNVYWWVGTSMSVTALDPFKFYGDVMYGEGNASDRQINKRGGLFFDVAAEYTGLDMVTPQLTFWYSTGEDGSTSNGSERMPSLVNYWGPSNSFLFDTNQEFNFGSMPLNSVGSWGLAFSLDKISFIQDLTHRITFTYGRGTNSSRALRNANLLTGVGNYVQMGRDLTTNEYVFGINFDNQYNIYQNLALIMETGWAHGSFEKSVWTRRFVNRANDGDAWKVALGLKYHF